MHEDEAANLALHEPRRPRGPDFIIGGAPKCGTTSLHFILDQHPDVALPTDEVHFFDADDPVSHPDFLRVEDGALKWWDPGAAAEDSQRWYAERFRGFGEIGLIGEDSTTYLMSEVAAKRIAQQLPEAKVIFMLRHPVRRAYSQYWHLVKTSRAVESFEQALVRYPQIMLGSSYAAGLKRFIDALGRDRVHICLFEDFRNDIQGCVDAVTGFLGLEPMQIDPERVWFNRTKYPSAPRFHRLANHVGRKLVRGRYNRHMGGEAGIGRRVENKLHYWWFAYVNPRFMNVDRPPEMREGTRQYLEQHLSARNAGLSQLLERDLDALWPGMRC
ncbi:sulfotransferase [Salipiger sp. PrR002]|uniref:sulfotransferase family protein n=1 Tax=Salipiger sp. PrR002 TaxID=2706489 RepID=UPI0013B72B6A|nr:sulfotransferase [Salipiger sp. PrR002]NDW01858.1 sulfotransferase [Salipiger sp. PrR002]NDW57846.1 sulfotransferase [Salipiger sp. PrR004]